MVGAVDSRRCMPTVVGSRVPKPSPIMGEGVDRQDAIARLRPARFWTLLAAAVLVASVAGTAHSGELPQDCVHPEVVLWGDGQHDDTEALNAWLRGRPAIWASDGSPVGNEIVGRTFRLSSAIYVNGGAERELRDFRLYWPERGEVVTGGTVRSSADPNTPPTSSGVTITGGDPGEGKPDDYPAAGAVAQDPAASCATS